MYCHANRPRQSLIVTNHVLKWAAISLTRNLRKIVTAYDFEDSMTPLESNEIYCGMDELTFSNAFSSLEIIVFLIKFHRSLFREIQQVRIDSYNGLLVKKRQAVIRLDDSLVYWRTYASQSLWVSSLRPSDAYMCQETNQWWFRQWLVALPAPSHCLNHFWGIVNWTLRNILQWNFNRNWNIFIQ